MWLKFLKFCEASQFSLQICFQWVEQIGAPNFVKILLGNKEPQFVMDFETIRHQKQGDKWQLHFADDMTNLQTWQTISHKTFDTSLFEAKS